jgi:hypothetical protein
MNNWELRGAGPDGQFDTADDVIVPLTLNTTYMVGTNRLNFTVDADMPPDLYQFRAYSGGLADPFGQPLDGNNSGAGGANFVRTFTLTGPAGTFPNFRNRIGSFHVTPSLAVFTATGRDATNARLAWTPMVSAVSEADLFADGEIQPSARSSSEDAHFVRQGLSRLDRLVDALWANHGATGGMDFELV